MMATAPRTSIVMSIAKRAVTFRRIVLQPYTTEIAFAVVGAATVVGGSAGVACVLGIGKLTGVIGVAICLIIALISFAVVSLLFITIGLAFAVALIETLIESVGQAREMIKAGDNAPGERGERASASSRAVPPTRAITRAAFLDLDIAPEIRVAAPEPRGRRWRLW